MKKNLWFWLTLLVTMALVAACGGAATPPAEEPAAEAPAATEEVAAEAPAATEEAAAEAPAATEEAAAEAPAATEEAMAESDVTIKFIGNPNGVNYELDKRVIDDFTKQTGIKVDFIAGPESATDRIAQYLQFLGAQSADLDVYQIDVIWPGILAEHMIDLNEYLSEEAKMHFPAIVENNTVDGKLIGMPFFTDAGLLYYRTDLLEKYGFDGPPETWDELEEMANTIQEGERAENPDFWGFVWQGQAYEGLTCDALEWQVSHGGGSIVEPDGTITINNPQAAAAFEKAAGWVGTISPPGVTGYQEEDSRGVWQAGNAAFMRNWPYAFSIGQEDDSVIKDKFDVTLLPNGGARNADTLGGWQMSVSKYSAHPQEAAEFVKYMTSPEVQLRRSIEGSMLPTIPDVYDDPQALEANPYYTSLKAVFAGGAVARPSTVTGELYNEVSTVYFTAVHSILTGEATAADALADLETELVDITGFETGAPPAVTESVAEPSAEEPAATEEAAAEGEAMAAGEFLTKARAGEFQGTTVSMMGPFTDEDAVKFDKSIEAFEQETGIDIQYEGTKEFEATISVRVDAGDAPDIVDFPQPGLLANFAREGNVVDLSTFLDAEQLKKNYNQGWLDMSMMEGPEGPVMAGIWARVNGKSLVWYPKDDWDAAGYEIPQTWADLMTLTQQIADDGDTPWCIGIESGAATGWPATDWLEEIMLRTTSLENYDKWVTGELKFDSPEVRNAVQVMSDIWLNDAYVYGGRASIVSTFFGDAPTPMFDSPPKCWLHKQGNFITSFFPAESQAGVDYDFFYLPPIDEQYGKPVLVAGDIYAMFNDRPEVRAVMEYFTLGESVKGWVEAGGAISPHLDSSLDWYTNDVDRGVAEIILNATSVRFDGSDLMPGEVGAGSFWKGMTDYVSDSADLDTALQEIDASWPQQ